MFRFGWQENAGVGFAIGGSVVDFAKTRIDLYKHHQEIMAPTASKRPHSDENAEMLNDGSAGKSTPGGTGADVQQVIIKNPSTANGGSMSFKKTFQIYTAGFKFTKGDIFNTLPLNVNNPFVSGCVGLTTPLACINPDQLPWYLTPAQYAQLPAFTYATGCSFKITPLGYRLPFATNEAESSYANSQTLVQIAHTKGLNTMYNLIKAGYASDQSDLTTPTGYTAPLGLQNLFYGLDGSIGCSIGVPRHYNAYTTIVTQQDDDIQLLDQLCVVNVNDCKGTPVINYNHEFKNGLLKVPNINGDLTSSYIMRRQMGPNTEGQASLPSVPQGRQANLVLDRGMPNATDGRTTGVQSTNSIETSLQSLSYNVLIEKAPYLQNQLSMNQSPDRPPLIHFGCMPVQSNAALATTATFSNVVVQWMIETELHVNWNMAYAQASVPLQYIKGMDPEIFSTQLSQVLTQDAIFISNRHTNFVTP